MKNLVLAEKPSVGKELARVLGCINRGKYLENEDYVVTWALGHLVTLCPPNHYGDEYKKWSLKTLPMLPPTLDTMVIEKTQEQYELVKSLLDREDVGTIIIATDAGREGELVARWILKQANCTKPTKRLWISSQTDLAIREGFANLKDGTEYDRLYSAAESRSFADWYIGYNVSRAMSCHFDTRLSAGRVQTPTLALMTSREDEIESFAGRFYWTLKADFTSFKASWYSPEGTVKIPEEATANALAEKLKGAKGQVAKLVSVPKSEKPPLAYDLTELQRDANTVLGFSAKETLDILQRLYEVYKIVTYPRTDSRYITDDIVPTFPQRLIALADTPFWNRASSYMKNGIRSDLSRLVNNEMVSDHHALLPTEQKVDLSKLSNDEKALWELIITRFLETISFDYEYKTTTLEAEVSGEKFLARLTVPVSQGWRDVARDIGKRSAVSDSNSEEQETGLAFLKEGSEIEIKDIALKRNATLPPDRYTEADLLYAMEHAGKFVEDAELKKRLENGLGTPATRADIIEKLIENNCIERHGKELWPTAKGRELVRLVPQQLKSAELTGKWEQRLFAIANGTESELPFISDIKKNAADLVKQVVANREKFDPFLMGDQTRKCPSCGWPMVKVMDEYERTHYVCQRFSCGYEEMLVKKKVESEPVVKHASASPVKKVIAVATPGNDGKKKIVIHKSAGKAVVPEVKWETVTEVVKPSHYRPPKPEFHGQRRDFKDKQYDNRNTVKHSEHSSSEGGTFADFIRASEERKRRDEEKKKRK